MFELTLFNINDITVIFSGFLSLVLALLLACQRHEGRIKKRYWTLLAAFFMLSVFLATNTTMTPSCAMFMTGRWLPRTLTLTAWCGRSG